MSYPPNTRASGVGEAYPGAMDESEGYSGDNNNNMMGMYGNMQVQDEGASSSGEPYSQQQYGGELDQSSVSTPRTAGGGIQRITDDHYSDDYSASRYSRRAIYEDAQFRSSSRTGGILHDNSGMSTSRRSFQQSSMMSSSHQNGSLHSSLRSSVHSASAGGQSTLDSYPSRQQEQPIRSVSLSGNLLVHVQIEEDEENELDKDEIKKMANTMKDNGDAAANEAQFQMLNDASTIGTTTSAQSKLQSNGNKNNVIVHGNPNDTILYPLNDTPLTDIDQARAKMKEILFSLPFRRTLFLGICFVLLGLGVLLTMENFMRVKTAQDWMEPHRDKYLLYNGGGLDWTFGSDAPKPIAGAAINYSVEYRIADWAHGTSRVPPTASIDGFGSVALLDTVMFKDVPLFWGLPFAGGSIMESVLGQCMNLVQASDGKGIQDGRGGDLHLSTIMIMGKKYLNVDLSTQEGIERASALALGTSGMADVVYSPLLHEVSELFSTMNQGRLFVMVRHPIEREFARFRYLRKWDHGKLIENDKSMSYVEFAHSDYVADNWMTRTLVGKGKDEELTAKDMHTAKEILRRKALVGLYSDIIGAVRHYARYFGWDNAMNGGKLNRGTLSCFESAILEGMKKDTYDAFNLVEEDAQEGSVAWRKIMEKNRYDFELYLYSQHLYKFQIALS
mmetsp:Transcript_3474/g.7660  ORF Transcript_3474/g.7660 Transcript_3474/m.7660 type:complete len:673 (-) Transcript_3474:154-2172(-)|eukprot:CAMPEP_0172324736 /NCGR_PEP_ID=MMETSP1058-20130122/52132_1 /TAXON_ID=83371 /ORGANISM="Detonula confervacea, Strain CCMP 353" /LENGTH=672 /DNA_ID=CAMNT_0013041097 /DNA_START=38 /DNA_END=2056 /DNA_ORIENTATION=-